jgi:hypothetical protein
MDILDNCYRSLKKLLTTILKESDNEIIISEDRRLLLSERRGITNMRDGGLPQVCHDRPGTAIRPVPYSFYGKCPMVGYYNKPLGMKRGDGTYEPCCYKLKKTGKDSKERYNKILIDGYPDAAAEGYNENIPDPDTESAIFRPGTKIIESRRFKGLNSFSKESIDNDFGYAALSSPVTANRIGV